MLDRSRAVEKCPGIEEPSAPAFRAAPSGAKGTHGVRMKPRSAMHCFLAGPPLVALTTCTRRGSSALFEDASAASDFGSDLFLNTPRSGSPFAVRLIDLDADGVDEILAGVIVWPFFRTMVRSTSQSQALLMLQLFLAIISLPPLQCRILTMTATKIFL